ncbi:MAG: DUF1684 domain-containing protein [Actinomycetota bacterium]
MSQDAPSQSIDEVMTLLDWKRRIFDLYSYIREGPEPEWAWRRWREARHELFATHPQSPLPGAARGDFTGLDYYDYDPAFRVLADYSDAAAEHYEIGTSGTEPMSFTRSGIVTFQLQGQIVELELYWLESYGGGLFLPFKDATSGDTTYGAGRYLLDTAKGSDLGTLYDKLVLDFNFAYNPSCSYDPRWVCPLATPANRIELPIEAGERHID